MEHSTPTSRRASVASNGHIVPSLSLDTRPSRVAADRPLSLSGNGDGSRDDNSDGEGEEGKVAARAELASIMTTTSNPVSAGPSSPPLMDPTRTPDFVPPARPSSTPFPQPEPRNTDIACARCPTGSGQEDDAMGGVNYGDPPPVATSTDSSTLNLDRLPIEIHECILDHLFGSRVSTTPKSAAGMPCVTRNWATVLRHSRRRELSELSLVSHTWRCLIQERLYRHIKLQATVQSINSSIEYLAGHPHLRQYVRHVEIWFPVFQPRHPSSTPMLLPTTNAPTVTATPIDSHNPASYVLPADNCTLEEVLYFIATTFPAITILTLEGGHRKKAPKVKHFIKNWGATPAPAGTSRTMSILPTVRTLVCKGQWNLVRNEEDFAVIASALPNLERWQASYSKAKSKSYLSMAAILPHRLPRTLKGLSLELEADYRREISFPPFFMKVMNRLHFCHMLGKGARPLEHLSYTGRVCRAFFDVLQSGVDPRCTRLRSIDLTVKNICRQVTHWNESGSGSSDWNFIVAFESLVLAGIRSLRKLTEVEYLRIRYVDLDSPIPALNPYFIMHRDGSCEGVWSDPIVKALHQSRPGARFHQLTDNPGIICYAKDGRMMVTPGYVGKITSFKLDNYKWLTVSGFGSST